jgi:hypothetical protein
MSELAAAYCRFDVNGQRLFPSYNLYGECVWNRPVDRYCEAGKACSSLLDCGRGYCASTGTCSAAKPTVGVGPLISPNYVIFAREAFAKPSDRIAQHC